MRSLKYLIKKEKPLVNLDVGFLTTTDTNINNLLNIRDNVTQLRIVGLPNTPIGLDNGSVWVDENGFVRIVL